jgi:predicted RNA-binding Zn-ribbon protein involved in translation (DUF1610 family)
MIASAGNSTQDRKKYWHANVPHYAKRPLAGPEAALAYLSRYAHRVAIANSRLIALDERGVTFRWKDYRAKGKTRHKTMTLTTEDKAVPPTFVCPNCGAAMIIIEILARKPHIRAPPPQGGAP